MYEDYYQNLTQDEIKVYLERLGLKFDPDRKPSKEYLDELIKAQLRHIPFSDADVWAKGVWPSLAIPDLYKKIIVEGRGGYCYELNSLFNRLLLDLGFDSYLVIIHLYRADIKFNAPSHCGIVATLDGKKHFVDVGFGGPVPDGCVEMSGVLEKGHKKYEDGVYTIVGSQNPDGSFLPRFKFKDMPCDPVELVPLNFHTSQRPDTIFRHSLELNLRFDNGFAEVHNKNFKMQIDGKLEERVLETEEDAKNVAEKVFTIDPKYFPTKPFEDLKR